jgi:hypothetical protein
MVLGIPRWRVAVVAAALLTLPVGPQLVPLHAQDVQAPPAGSPAGPQPSPSAETPEARRKREFREAIDAVQTVAKPGPVDVPMINQGALKVPAGYIFVPSLETAKLMRAMGNRTGQNLIGMLFSAADGLNWFALVTYNKAGYVKDDDAKDWKADELLSQLREGTEGGNADRRAVLRRWRLSVGSPLRPTTPRRTGWSGRHCCVTRMLRERPRRRSTTTPMRWAAKASSSSI